LDALQQPFRPNMVAAYASDDVERHESIPLLSGRSKICGATAVYVCRSFVCKLPATSAEETAALLSAQ